MKTTNHHFALRSLALVSALVALIAGVLFFSPPTRALADNLIHQFGGYIFVQATPEEKGPPEKPAPANPEEEKAARQVAEDHQKAQKLADENTQIIQALDTSAASQQAGFDLLAPAYVPAGYFPTDETHTSIGWEVSHNDGNVTALARYIDPTSGDFLVIEEDQVQQGTPRTVDRPDIQDVTVRGQSGVWMPDEGGKSVLAWNENGITFLVVSNKLSHDELLKVAESLGM